MYKMKVAILVLCAASVAMAAPSADWRIVNGEKAADGQFPYQVSLRSFGSHSCGGSILDETTILCAAHCVVNQFPFAMTVRVGNNKLSAQTETYQVSKLIPHKQYNAREIYNDISIVKLASPIKFRPGAVEAVELRQTNIGEDTVILSGWGTTSYPGSTPNDLQFIEMKTITTERCAKEQENMGLPIFDTQVCTVTKKDSGACHGDSGGPLVDQNKQQVGIVSWGNPCAQGNPDVFTRVYSFLDWIEQNRK